MSGAPVTARRSAVWLRVWRAGVMAAVAGLLHTAAEWRSARQPAGLTLEQARRYFPKAAVVETEGPGRVRVKDAAGVEQGELVGTSPEGDRVIGYSGPTRGLVALGTDGAVRGVEILSSGDTPEHVEEVVKDGKFLPGLAGWRPGEGGAPPRVEAVSGATLTSLALVEAIQKKLGAGGKSLRFTKPVTLEEVRGFFPTAAGVALEGDRTRVVDAAGVLLGWAVRTSPEADNVSGYAGPTECLVGLDAAGTTVVGVQVHESYDTESYVQTIRDDTYYRGLFKGRTVEELGKLDYAAAGFEGVSGATLTSWAMAEGIKKRFARKAAAPAVVKPLLNWTRRDTVLAAVLAGALVMAFTRLRGNAKARLVWNAVLVGALGLMNGDMISLTLLGGWGAHGAGWRTAPGLVLLAAAALLVPWGVRRQLYCHHVCPHGAAQSLLGAVVKKKWTVPAGVAVWLGRVPFVLLAVALVSAVAGWGLDLAALEPFEAWLWPAAGVASAVIAVAGLVAAVKIPQAYCHYGCPTGALLKFVRSTGAADRWNRRDTAAVALLLLGAAGLWWGGRM